jgi:hypothetical protein
MNPRGRARCGPPGWTQIPRRPAPPGCPHRYRRTGTGRQWSRYPAGRLRCYPSSPRHGTGRCSRWAEPGLARRAAAPAISAVHPASPARRHDRRRSFIGSPLMHPDSPRGIIATPLARHVPPSRDCGCGPMAGIGQGSLDLLRPSLDPRSQPGVRHDSNSTTPARFHDRRGFRTAGVASQLRNR